MISGKSRGMGWFQENLEVTGCRFLKLAQAEEVLGQPLAGLVRNHLDVFKIPLDPLGLSFLVFILDWDADELLNAEENVGLSFPFL